MKKIVMNDPVKTILNNIDGDRPFALYCDYDGTLTPIVQNPSDAVLSQEHREFLQSLAMETQVEFTLISGRPIQTLKTLSGLHGIHWVGTHGYEIETADGHVTYTIDAGFWKQIESTLEDRFSPLLEGIPGTRMEAKPASFAFHYRQVDPERHTEIVQQADALLNELTDGNVNIIRGKEIIEVKPKGFDKGIGLLYLRNLLGLSEHQELYLGDDTTDQDALRALPDSALKIWVGESMSDEAQYNLPDVSAVYWLLQGIKNRVAGE